MEDALARYTYDRNGNLIQRIHKAGGLSEFYAYDSENHLIGYELKQGAKLLRNAAYIHDGLGQRVGKLVDPDGAGLSHSYFLATLYADENLTGVVKCDKAGEAAKIPAIANGRWTGFADAPVAVQPIAGGEYDRNDFHEFESDGHQKQVLDSMAPEGCYDLAAIVQNDELDSPQWITTDINRDGVLDLSESYTVIQDHLGSVVALLTAEGNIEAQYVYDSFGNFAVVTSAGQVLSGSAVPEHLALFTYTGRSFDPESGLFHYRARAYDAKSGRFLQEDPIWDTNLYAYVGNSPIGFKDPKGETVALPIKVPTKVPRIPRMPVVPLNPTPYGVAAMVLIGASFLAMEYMLAEIERLKDVQDDLDRMNCELRERLKESKKDKKEELRKKCIHCREIPDYYARKQCVDEVIPEEKRYGPYRWNDGHHVFIDSAFTGAIGNNGQPYDRLSAFSIGDVYVECRKILHPLMSSYQHSRYAAICRDPYFFPQHNTMELHYEIGLEALIKGEVIDRSEAVFYMEKGLKYFKETGIDNPTKIPWCPNKFK